MCGIAGIVASDRLQFDERARLEAMRDIITHRGPDDAGLYVDGRAALGHRRLSIVDLAAGHQPLANEDETVWIVFNGEIYNHADVRPELEREGHRYRTRSDTETIVHAYEQWGDACVNRLRGMFAFGIWDAPRRRLLLARDRLGVKPLYWADVNGRLLFASEIKSILESGLVAARANEAALPELLSTRYLSGTQTLFGGIHRLLPGHTLVYENGRVTINQYWDVPTGQHVEEIARLSDQEAVQRFRDLLEQSVRIRLMADVPLGMFLSGGIDSSAVAALMAGMIDRPLQTFSVAFKERAFSELDYARQVSAAIKADAHEIVIDDEDFFGALPKLIWHEDEPIAHPSSVPLYFVSELARRHVTVVLSGDGGDELFAGYDKYRVERKERTYERLPAPARALLGQVGRLAPQGMPGRNFLRHVALSGWERYLDASTLFPLDEQRKLFRPEVRALVARDDPRQEAMAHLRRPSGHWLSSLQYLDLKSYLPLDILTKVDRLSMAHSIEARVPLLDHKLVEFVARLPPEMKLRGDTGKYVFKRAMRGILPDAIIDRPKKGFAIPLERWFRGRLAELVSDLLLGETTRQRRIFDSAYLEGLIERYRTGRRLDWQIWTFVSFEMWCRVFLDRPTATARTERPVAGEGPLAVATAS
jgi:asparagine synthase (glutamine-hydrolysing)